MKKFIEVTDARETVGVEKIKNRNTLLNVDQIVTVQALEPHIAEEVGYNTVIVTTQGHYCIVETMKKIENLISLAI